jgi:hypothetical protein
MQLTWIKCQGEVWCSLSTVNLSHAHFEHMNGVYIIWHGGSTPATVYVGQGYIRDRLTAHRSDLRIQAFAPLGLYVTWAPVQEPLFDGVEAFLAQVLKPKVGDVHPATTPIPVNLPW